MKVQNIDRYVVIFLNGKAITDDLNDCVIVSCSNKPQLEKVTDIGLNRLVYIFTKLKKKVHEENDMLIIKSGQFFKGGQEGGLRNPALISRNRKNDY